MRWSCALLCLVAACAPHVTLDPVRPGMSQDERVAMFDRDRSAGNWVTCTNTSCARTSAVTNDGTEVEYPEDLLPILPPDGATARAAVRAAADRQRKRWLIATGMTVFVAGGVVAGATFNAAVSNDTGINRTELGVAGGLIAVAFAVLATGIVYGFAENREKAYVFDHYTRDLAGELHVCVNGLSIVACEESQPGPAVDPNIGSLRQQ